MILTKNMSYINDYVLFFLDWHVHYEHQKNRILLDSEILKQTFKP